MKGLLTLHGVHGEGRTPSIAFRHLPPNSARTGYATEGALPVCYQFFETYGVIINYASGWRKDIVNQCLEFEFSLLGSDFLPGVSTSFTYVLGRCVASTVVSVLPKHFGGR